MAETALQPLDLLASLVLEDGQRWGDVAADFQWADAESIFNPADVLWHFLTRPRGGSKSTDLAGVLLAWVAVMAAPGERGYIVATDRDQGAFAVLDALTGLVRRTPALRSLVEIQSSKVVAKSGATVEVLSADGASTLGLRPSFVVVDEVAAWPATRNARLVWVALVSALGKVPGCRFVVMGSAGDPGHWSFKVLKEARKSERWHTNEVPGPLPWVDPENLEAQRPLLRDSEFSQYHLNVWTASEDRLVTEEDLAAAAVLDGPQEPLADRRYVVAVDLGLINDRAIAVVAHAVAVSDEDGAPKLVVVDAIGRWQGSRRKPVELGDVEAWLLDVTRRYNHAKVVIDPWQAAGLCQRLRQQGMAVEEFTFSSASVGRIGSALHLALRNRLLHLPDDEDLLNELGNVRLKETTPGVVRLDHDAGQHDDQAVSIGMAIVELTTHGQFSGLWFSDINDDEDGRRQQWVESLELARGLGMLPQPAKAGLFYSGDTSMASALVGGAGDAFNEDRDDSPNGKTAKSPYVV